MQPQSVLICLRSFLYKHGYVKHCCLRIMITKNYDVNENHREALEEKCVDIQSKAQDLRNETFESSAVDISAGAAATCINVDVEVTNQSPS